MKMKRNINTLLKEAGRKYDDVILIRKWIVT